MMVLLPMTAAARTPPATLSAALAPAWSGTVTDGAASFVWSTSAKSGGTYKRIGGSANFDATRYSTDATRGVDADCRHDPALDCFCTTLSPFAVYPGVLAFTDGKVKGDVADQMRYSSSSAGVDTYTLAPSSTAAATATFDVTSATGAPVRFVYSDGVTSFNSSFSNVTVSEPDPKTFSPACNHSSAAAA